MGGSGSSSSGPGNDTARRVREFVRLVGCGRASWSARWLRSYSDVLRSTVLRLMRMELNMIECRKDLLNVGEAINSAPYKAHKVCVLFKIIDERTN